MIAATSFLATFVGHFVRTSGTDIFWHSTQNQQRIKLVGVHFKPVLFLLICAWLLWLYPLRFLSSGVCVCGTEIKAKKGHACCFCCTCSTTVVFKKLIISSIWSSSQWFWGWAGLKWGICSRYVANRLNFPALWSMVSVSRQGKVQNKYLWMCRWPRCPSCHRLLLFCCITFASAHSSHWLTPCPPPLYLHPPFTPLHYSS